MKFKTVKTIVMAFASIAVAFASLTAEAIRVPGRLGATLVAADAYTFTCPSGTTRVQARVFDPNTIANLASTVYATFGEDGSPTLSVLDNETTSAWSPWAINTSDGLGIYALVVRKTAAKLEDYIVETQCLNSLGAVIGPSPPRLTVKINQ
ncbi:MAG: hypothetical protein HOO93_03695 [Methyloglobulus sp.]|nr:hypothetical protein [Methyloglobulus sp.]